jgi:hypothetical protein
VWRSRSQIRHINNGLGHPVGGDNNLGGGSQLSSRYNKMSLFIFAEAKVTGNT